MQLRIMGCSGGEAEGERLTGLLINGTVAIDAGSITQALSVAEQIRIRHIFISHSHLDHICTLPFFTKNIFGHNRDPWRSMPCPRPWMCCGATFSMMNCGRTSA